MAAKKAGSTSRAARGARAPKKVAARAATKPAHAKPAATKNAVPAKATAPAKTAAPAKAAAPTKAAAPAKPTAPAFDAPNSIGAWHLHLDYTSHDMKAIKRFYTETLGFSRFIEEANVGYLSIRTSPASTVGFMAPAPGPPDQWRPPGEPGLYFFVHDVDRAHRDLVAKGVEFTQAPADMPWGHRIAMCRDPEGRTVILAQDPTRDPRS